MEKEEFLTAVNRALREQDPDFQEEIRSCFSARFWKMPRSQWRDDRPVRLHSVHYGFVIPEDTDEILFQVEVVLDYDTLLATARSRHRTGLAFDPSLLPVLLDRASHNRYLWIMATFQALPLSCRLRPDGSCTSDAFVSVCRKVPLHGYEGRTFLEYVRDRLSGLQPELEKECRDLLRAGLLRLQMDTPHAPNWLCPAHLGNVQITLDMSEARIPQLHCSAGIWYARLEPFSVQMVGTSLPDTVLGLKPEDLGSFLDAQYRSLLQDAVQQILRSAPPFVVEPSDPDSGFPPDFWDFLQTGAADTPLCSILSDFHADGRLLVQTGWNQVAIAGRPLNASSLRPVPLGLLDSSPSLYGVAMPTSLYTTFCLLKDAAAMYEQADFGSLSKPRLIFHVENGTFAQVSYGTRKLRVRPEEFSIRGLPHDWFQELFQVIRQYARLDIGSEARMEIFSSLNPTVLAILQFIYREKRVWYQLLLEQLAPSLLTTRDSLRQYLNEAGKVAVPVYNVPQLLIRSEVISRSRGQSFTVFRPAVPPLTEEVLAASPGPYRIPDVPHLPPEARLQCLEREAEENTENVQDILYLLGTLPRVTVTSFVRSDTGQRFLCRLEGPDREQARTLLWELPGCRKLAARLLAPLL